MLAPRPQGKGMEIPVTVYGPAVANPMTGDVTRSEAVYIGSGIMESYDSEIIDGATIQADDVKVILSPVAVDGADMPPVKTGDQVTLVAGAVAVVVRASPWNYAGVLCGFELQVRTP